MLVVTLAISFFFLIIFFTDLMSCTFFLQTPLYVLRSHAICPSFKIYFGLVANRPLVVSVINHYHTFLNPHGFFKIFFFFYTR